MKGVAFVKCVLCRRELTLQELEQPCPFCGETECYVNGDGERVCACPVDGDPYRDLSNRPSDPVMCRACEETFDGYGSTLMIAHPRTGLVRFIYQSPVLKDPEGDFERLPQDLQKAVAAIVVGTRWHRVDPWRGYEQPPRKAGRFVMVMDGWHSTWLGDRSELSEALNAILRREAGLDFPVLVVFGRTSNLFAIGISVYAQPAERDRVVHYLQDKKASAGVLHRVEA